MLQVLKMRKEWLNGMLKIQMQSLIKKMFLVFLVFVITIAWDDGFANRNRAFDDAFGGFVGDFGRDGDNFMHAAT